MAGFENPKGDLDGPTRKERKGKKTNVPNPGCSAPFYRRPVRPFMGLVQREAYPVHLLAVTRIVGRVRQNQTQACFVETVGEYISSMGSEAILDLVYGHPLTDRIVPRWLR